MSIAFVKGVSAASVIASDFAGTTWNFNLTEFRVTNTFTIRADIRLVGRALDGSSASSFSALVGWGTDASAVGASVWSGNRAAFFGETVSWVLSALLVWALESVGLVLGAVVALVSADISRFSASVIQAQELASRAAVGNIALAQ